MRRITLLCSALIVSALAAPAMAQQAPNSAQSASTSAQTGNKADAAANNQSTMSNITPSDQTAMNGNGNNQMSAGSSSSNLSSVPDNRHKYSRTSLAADNRSEAQTTKELNQAEANMNANTQSQ